MFTRAAGPACVNGCVRGDPQTGHSLRAGGSGVAGGRASLASSCGRSSSPIAALVAKLGGRYFLFHVPDDEDAEPAALSFFA